MRNKKTRNTMQHIQYQIYDLINFHTINNSVKSMKGLKIGAGKILGITMFFVCLTMQI